MKTVFNNKSITFALLAAFAVGCATIPAEESIDTSCFHANFETLKGVTANWGTTDTLLAIDAENKPSRFFLTFGQNSSDGEFYGETSLKTHIKYAVYSTNLMNVSFAPADTSFCVEIPAEYKALSTSSLVTANNASIGVMSGSSITMKTVGGFIKLTLLPNGETAYLNGVEYDLTDIAKVEIMDSLKCLAGRVKVSMSGETPVLKEVLPGGSGTITFVPMQIKSSDGKLHYAAGDYYLPVIPQAYEGITYNIYDEEGRCTHNYYKTHKSLSPARGTASVTGDFEWPTMVLSAAFNLSQTPTEAGFGTGFGSNNTGCDCFNKTTGVTYPGETSKKTELTLTHNGVKYICATTMGIGAGTSSSKVAHLLVNAYNTDWNYTTAGGKIPVGHYIVGTPSEYAWIKIPAQDAVLSKVEYKMSCGAGKLYISDAVDSVSYAAAGNILATIEPAVASAEYVEYIKGAEAGKPYYMCFGAGNNYKVYTWKLSYKLYE